MKITLKNFRCYENSTFDFGDEGLTLLSGSSGSGKTSIMLGIYFALFGTGNKLSTYGKTSCCVTLDLGYMTITRTKRPNRLVVTQDDIEYEDESGQSIIDKKFGESFKTTGYISQNARDSFILMSPIEKLAFLESFAFNDINLSQIKKRCKDLIKERNDTLLKTTSQLELASSMVGEMEKPEKVEFPLKCSQKNIEKSIKNETIRCKNTDTLVKRCKKKINSLQKELQSLKILNAQIESKLNSLESVTEKLADISLEEDKIEYKGDDHLEEYESHLLQIISQRELIILQNRYDEDVKRLNDMKKNELIEKDEKIKDVEKCLWQEYSKEECDTTIKDYKQIIKDLEKLTELNTDLKRYTVDEDQLSQMINDLNTSKETLENKKKILDKLEMQQEVFHCPSCSISLRFQNDELHIHDSRDNQDNDEAYTDNIDTVTEEISKLKHKILSLESSIPIKQNKLERSKEISKSIDTIKNQYEEVPDLSEMKTELDYIHKYRSSQDEMVKQLNKLQSGNTHSSTILSFEKSVKKQEIKLQEMKKDSTNNQICMDEEEIRHNIISQKQNKEKLNNIKHTLKKLSSEKTTYEKQLDKYKEDHLATYKTIRTECLIDSNIKSQLSELSSLETKLTEHQKNMQDIEKYEKYQKSKDVYETWTNKIKILQKEELECRKQYASSTLLREKILEAESIAMLNIIASINTHSQVYLDAFFPDNPISVRLVPFKETKKGSTITKKPQINLEIEYKGMEADTNMLSGGELSRVILAYALALGEMFNTPMMLLDECTASLDQELTGEVMDGIRENFTGKLVLLVCHQVVKGQFDKVIKIGE